MLHLSEFSPLLNQESIIIFLLGSPVYSHEKKNSFSHTIYQARELTFHLREVQPCSLAACDGTKLSGP